MSRVNWPKWLAYTLSVLFLSTLQSQTDFFPKIVGMAPLFIIPAVICIAIFEGENIGGIYGIIAGLIWDCGTNRIFGFNALFLMILGICAGLLVKFLFRRSLLTAAVFTVIFTLTHEMVTYFFFYYLTGLKDFVYAFSRIILPTTAYTFVFLFLFYFGVRFLHERLTEDE